MIVTGSARRMSPSAAPTPPDPVVLIVSSAYSSLPAPGNRVGTGDASNMPTIQASTGNPAIQTASGAHHYRLVGLQIKAPTTLLQNAVLKVGGGETTLGAFPADIIVDRCIVRGDATNGLRRGVEMEAIRGAIVDSYIYDCKENGSDSQGVWFYNTPGPVKVVNNYIEAAGENMMTGGADPSYANSVPSDLEIRRNYFKKQSYASWAASWAIKNILEFKNAQRVLVEGNVFDGNYNDSQDGHSLLCTPRNQNGTAPWCVVQDITYRYNKLTNAEGGFNILGTDNEQSSQRTKRITMKHCVFELANQGSGAGIMRGHTITGGPEEVQITNNTWIFLSGGSSAGFFDSTSPKILNPIWRDNIFAAGSYGILGNLTGEGTATLNGHASGYTYSYNVMIGSSNTGSYPAANNQFPANTAAVGFTDYAGGDYSLTVGSTYKGDGSDGNDPGVNWTAYSAAIANTVAGNWNDQTTYTDRTYTNAELPREYIDSTYRAQTGTTWNCTTAAEFTTALAGCALGDTIVLTAGNTFTGSFTLRDI